MKIFSIMLVKDEADIVASVIKDAEKWADKIFILDNGSTDGTWEIIQSLKNDVVMPLRQDFRPFSRGMRAEIFNEYKHLASDGDWWCLALDADEFYVENPKQFLESIPKNCHLVAKKSLDYSISSEDIEEFDFKGSFEEDKANIRYLNKTCWSEPRFFRFRKNLKWSTDMGSQYPIHAGNLADKKILVKHYQFRSPQQMQKRLDVRNASEAKKQGLAFRHVKETDWHELTKPRSELVFDDGSMNTYDSLPVRNNMHQGLIKKMVIRILIKLGVYN